MFRDPRKDHGVSTVCAELHIFLFFLGISYGGPVYSEKSLVLFTLCRTGATCSTQVNISQPFILWHIKVDLLMVVCSTGSDHTNKATVLELSIAIEVK